MGLYRFLGVDQVDLRRAQLGMAQHELDIGQRNSRVLRHPICRRVPQRMQRGRGPNQGVHPLEHPMSRVLGQRPDRTPPSPPQRLTPAGRDQTLHLQLVKP